MKFSTSQVLCKAYVSEVLYDVAWVTDTMNSKINNAKLKPSNFCAST